MKPNIPILLRLLELMAPFISLVFGGSCFAWAIFHYKRLKTYVTAMEVTSLKLDMTYVSSSTDEDDTNVLSRWHLFKIRNK